MENRGPGRLGKPTDHPSECLVAGYVAVDHGERFWLKIKTGEPSSSMSCLDSSTI